MSVLFDEMKSDAYELGLTMCAIARDPDAFEKKLHDLKAADEAGKASSAQAQKLIAEAAARETVVAKREAEADRNDAYLKKQTSDANVQRQADQRRQIELDAREKALAAREQKLEADSAALTHARDVARRVINDAAA